MCICIYIYIYIYTYYMLARTASAAADTADTAEVVLSRGVFVSSAIFGGLPHTPDNYTFH